MVNENKYHNPQNNNNKPIKESKQDLESEIAATKFIGTTILVFLIFLIFIIALFLRLFNLGNNPPGLYSDEMQFMLSAYNQMKGGIPILREFGHFSLVGYIWVIITGYVPSILLFHTSSFAARFPVGLYGSLIIFPLYLLSKEITENDVIALISSLLWATDPLAIVMSRVGYGVEIFPLFLFLFFLIFLLRYRKDKRLGNFIGASVVLFLIFYFSTLRIWAGIPVISILIYFIFLKLSSRFKIVGSKGSYTYRGLFAVAIVISFIWVLLYFGSVVLPRIGMGGLFGGIFPSRLTVNLPFPKSISIFLAEVGYGLSPWKMFWVAEFTSAGISTSGTNVSFMFFFLAPFFYYSVFILPFRIRHSEAGSHSYSLLIALIIFGILTPSFYYIVPPPEFQTALAMFALPPFLILSSISIVKFAEWVKKEIQHPTKKISNSGSVLSKRMDRRKFIVIALAVILAGSVATSGTLYANDFYVSYPNYLADNGSYEIWYGWDEISTVLVDTGLYKLPISYTPGVEGQYNLANPNNFNYYYFELNYPLYWLFAFSDGKITEVGAIHYDSLPNLSLGKQVIVSQNPNYTQILANSNISYHVFFTLFKPNGTMAIQIIVVYPRVSSISS